MNYDRELKIINLLAELAIIELDLKEIEELI